MKTCSLLSLIILLAGCATHPLAQEWPKNGLVIINSSSHELTIDRNDVQNMVTLFESHHYQTRRISAHETLVLTDIQGLPKTISVDITATGLVGTNTSIVGNRRIVVHLKSGKPKVITISHFW